MFEKLTAKSYDSVRVWGLEGRDGDGINFAVNEAGAATHHPEAVMWHTGRSTAPMLLRYSELHPAYAANAACERKRTALFQRSIHFRFHVLRQRPFISRLQLRDYRRRIYRSH